MTQYDKKYTTVIPAAEDYSFAGRLKAMRERKLEQTAWKSAHTANMDEDDYGYVPPPEGFRFVPEFNDPEHQTFYGGQAWAKNFSELLKVHPVYIDENDALCGRWMFILQRLRPFKNAISDANLEMAPIFDFEWLKEDQKKYNLIPGIGKMHHFAPDYRMCLELGWGGLREKVKAFSAVNRSQESQELYRAEMRVLDGIYQWMNHSVQALEELERTLPQGAVRDNVHKMNLCNSKILTAPPETFLEACQWIAWANMINRTYDRAGAGCQLDTLLYPYYSRDIQAGILTPREARFILSCLFLNDPTYYQIGGPDSMTGKDVTNALSYLILEAAHDLKTTINLTIRCFDGMDRELLHRGIAILLEDKRAYPRFSGDKALVEGFVKNGYSREMARQRIAVGCNWMSLPGLEYTMNDLVKVNMAKVFEVAFYECAGHEDTDTEKLFDCFARHLRRAVDCLKEGIDFHLRNQYRNAPELVLNLMSHGPIEKGLDVSHGGAEYYNIAIDGAGIAVVADSFAALQQRVEQEKRISWQECASALRENFSGNRGAYIQAMLSSCCRYGHGGTPADGWAVRVSRLFTHLVVDTPTPDGYRTIPGLFSWANTIAFGKTVGATPNGRFAGEPINQGANPNPGFRKDGACSAMGMAVASVQPGYGNTAPWQLELDLSMICGEEAEKNVAALIDSHFEQGGTLINMNIVDRDVLRAAYAEPEKYPELVVRVTGFTAYFSTLSPEFRKMIVDRTVTEI